MADDGETNTVTVGRFGPAPKWLAVPIGLAMAAGVGGVSALSAGNEVPNGSASAEQSDYQASGDLDERQAEEQAMSAGGSTPIPALEEVGPSEGTAPSSVSSSAPPAEVRTRTEVLPSVVSATYEAGVGIVVRAVVLDVVEDSGTCILRASDSDGQTRREAEGEAVPSAESMNCVPGMIIPDSELVDGTWHVRIAYDSSDFEGTSQVEDVVVKR